MLLAILELQPPLLAEVMEAAGDRGAAEAPGVEREPVLLAYTVQRACGRSPRLVWSGTEFTALGTERSRHRSGQAGRCALGHAGAHSTKV
mmetsp:Transcript_11146/g.17521  ORF Transcript_11146/g.17521 Transcript_11146/m.17521 type:complete len:90 (-) Transcript_11146:35-304(-)